jgi:hypothetical protein
MNSDTTFKIKELLELPCGDDTSSHPPGFAGQWPPLNRPTWKQKKHTPLDQKTRTPQNPAQNRTRSQSAAPHGRRLIGEEGVRPGAKFHKLHPGQSTQAPSLALLKQEAETFFQWGGRGRLVTTTSGLASCRALGKWLCGGPTYIMARWLGEERAIEVEADM